MKSKILEELIDIVGEEQIETYRQRNEGFKEKFIKEVGDKARQSYGIEPIIDSVLPRDPFIDSRVLVVPPKETYSQKYDLLQTFGGGNISSVDVVSLPEGGHSRIQEKYIQEMLNQLPWYYIAGGHIEFKDKDNIKIHSESGDYGKSLAGYDSNNIAAYILGMTDKFNKIDVEKETKLKTDADEFFDSWLGLFKETTSQGKPDDFFKEAYQIHREKSSIPLSRKYLAETYIRAMNDPRAEHDLTQAIVDSMFEVQREAFQEAIKNRFKK